MNPIDSELSPEQRSLLEKAAEWRLISLLFECPTGFWSEQVAQLKGDIRDPELQQAADAAQAEASEGMYHSLFGPGGRVPLREVAYHPGLEAGHLLSKLSACYKAFGYAPATMEADDHLAVEAGFVSYLYVKEAYALSCGDMEHALLTFETAESFRKDHLAMFVTPLVEALEVAAPSYLVLAGKVLQSRFA